MGYKTTLKKFYLILGIRPDLVRSAILIQELRRELGPSFSLIWSGQHYSRNLKELFLKELSIENAEVELGIRGRSDSEMVSDLIKKLGKFLEINKPEAVAFLGDTNTVMGTIAAAQLNIPILHIEGGMRSYDWRMPEEKYRKIADHLADTIYAYLPAYAAQAISEGIPENNVEITGNPIVDIIQDYFISGKIRMNKTELKFLMESKYKIKPKENYILMTCHRRENIAEIHSLTRIIELAGAVREKVVFPAGDLTQRMLKYYKIKIPENLQLVDPIGYIEILELVSHASFVITDSGTLVEECAILGVPSLQTRKSTERPEVYEWGASIKFDPSQENVSVLQRLQKIRNIEVVH